jgi:hypothetical protein
VRGPRRRPKRSRSQSGLMIGHHFSISALPTRTVLREILFRPRFRNVRPLKRHGVRAAALAHRIFPNPPAATITLMRLSDMDFWPTFIGHLEFWPAFIGIVIVRFVTPAGCFVLAIMAGYYLWQADFNWREAASPTPSTFSFDSLSPENFNEFKTKQMKYLERSCKGGVKPWGEINGRIPVAASKFCECAARMLVEAMTKEDFVYQENHGGYPADFGDRKNTALASCANEQERGR